MKFVTNNGFTLIESLLAFIVISIILVLFVPGISQINHKKRANELEIKKWRLFYELSHLDAKDTTHITDWKVDDKVWVSQFMHTDLGFSIYFSDGSHYEVNIQSIQ